MNGLRGIFPRMRADQVSRSPKTQIISPRNAPQLTNCQTFITSGLPTCQAQRKSSVR